MAKVAKIAERIPFAPTWAYVSISAVVALAAIAAALSKPQMGFRLIPFALELTIAEIVRVTTQVISIPERIV